MPAKPATEPLDTPRYVDVLLFPGYGAGTPRESVSAAACPAGATVRSPMTATASSALHIPTHPVRFVTAASLFDGHDAAINVMRRLLQSQGAEVVHLGHDRSVDTVVRAAVEEDVQGVAISSYQGGHVEYFSYLVERLADAGAGHVRVFGGGGGVIVPEEIALLRERGVTIFAPEDGQRLGLPGMINELIRACDTDLTGERPDAEALLTGDPAALARAITVLEDGRSPELAARVREAASGRTVPVLGITGTGGGGEAAPPPPPAAGPRAGPGGQGGGPRPAGGPPPRPRRGGGRGGPRRGG